MKKILIFLTSVCMILMAYVPLFASQSCEIDGQAIPELIDYNKRIDTQLREIQSLAGKQSSCGVSSRGSIAAAERTVDTVDRAFLDFPVFDTTLLDYAYNIETAFE